MNIIELAKEADIHVAHLNKPMTDEEVRLAFLERFAALVRAESAKEDLEVLENLRKETIAQCEAGMIEAYQLGRAERKWVDLTDDEIDELIRKWCSPDMGLLDFAWAAIAAFKEKNK